MEAALINAQAEEAVPAWVGKLITRSTVFQKWPFQLVLTIVHAANLGYNMYAAMMAVHAAGLAYDGTMGCAFRASLWFQIWLVMIFMDWLSMIFCSRDPALPTPWKQDKLGLAVSHTSFQEFPIIVLVASVLQFTPLLIWLRHGLAEYVGNCVLLFFLGIQHNILNTLTFDYWARYMTAAQKKLQHQLVTGELPYDAAINAFKSLNSTRRAVAKSLANGAFFFWALFLVQQAVLLYDFELRSWGSWPFLIILICNTVSFLLFLTPWIGLNDWPDELMVEIMESSELAWSPSERTNFAQFVATTKVNITLLQFEMSSSFRTAVPLIFVGWWLYMNELEQFHSFTGFPFDPCFNHSVAGEDGGHGHH